jgi:outer membrane lipoprotein-sorting protein
MVLRKLLPLFLFITCFEVSAQTLDRILQQHYQAHNQQFWDQIRSLTATGNWTSEFGDYSATYYIKRPEKFKVINVEQRFIEAYDGNQFWTIGSWTENKVQLLDPVRSMMLYHVFDFGSPISMADDLELKGRVEVDNIPCYWLIKKQVNQITEIFIDRRTNLLYRTILTDSWHEYDRVVYKTIKKYRNLQGMLIPTVIEIKTNDLVSEYVFDDFFLGDAVSDSQFAMPE